MKVMLLSTYCLYSKHQKNIKRINTSRLTTFHFLIMIHCGQIIPILSKTCDPQSKYPVLHLVVWDFCFFGRLGSQTSTEKKGLGWLWATSKGGFFMFSGTLLKFCSKFLNSGHSLLHNKTCATKNRWNC